MLVQEKELTCLSNLQADFKSAMLKEASDITNDIFTPKSDSIKTRIKLYQQSYLIRLQKALTRNFPALYSYIGHHDFYELAKTYIYDHPSKHYSIRWFGNNLPQFLKHYYNESEYYLSELAAFEWKMALSYDSVDSETLTFSQLKLLDPQNWLDKPLQLHASVQRLDTYYNIDELWQTIHKKNKTKWRLKRHHKLQHWIFRRDNLKCYYDLLNSEQLKFFNYIQAGRSFSTICEKIGLGLCVDEAGKRASFLLKEFIDLGLINKFK